MRNQYKNKMMKQEKGQYNKGGQILLRKTH